MSTAPVQAFEKILEYPGYEPGPDERVPNFLTDGYMRVYPYPARDHLTFDKKTIPCRAMILENEFLRATVMPRFGGHLWSLYDKLRNREVFYTPDIIKPGLIALPGAWMPVGVEFNFPIGHTVMSCSPIAAQMRSNPDGSASVFVGDTELSTRMRWQVRMTLRPGVAALEIETRLANPTPLEHRWYLWANAAVEATPGWQFCAPAKYGVRHWTGEKIQFPVHEDRQVARYDNYTGGANEFFAGGMQEDFYGCYNHDDGSGIVHWSRWQDMLGKKFFTWGCGPEGKAWGRIFCDDPAVRHYVEIQCGPFETQGDYEFFEPRGERAWGERWYPLDQTGPFFFANAQIALGLRGEGKARTLTFFPCEDFGTVSVEVKIGAQKRIKKLTLKAGHLAEWPAPGDKALSIKIMDAAGAMLVATRHPYPTTLEKGFEARLKRIKRKHHLMANAKSAKDKLEACRQHLRYGQLKTAMKWLDEGLKALPKHVDGRLMRGQFFMKRGLFAQAAGDFKVAATAKDKADAAQGAFFLGVALRAQGKFLPAAESFAAALEKAPAGHPVCGSAEQALAELDLLAGQADAARLRLNRICGCHEEATAERRALLALARRLTGDPYGARASADGVCLSDPLYLPGHFERAYAYASGAHLDALPGEKLFESKAHPYADRYLEAAWWYANLGQFVTARQVLALARLEDPRAEYFAAWLANHAENPDAAVAVIDAHLDRAAGMQADYVFPFRSEELGLLNWVIERRPKDSQALRLRGTLLGSFFRPAEAFKDMHAATVINPKDALAWRNAALIRAKDRKTLPEAIELMERAQAADPAERDIACELLSLYDQAGNLDGQLALIERVPENVRECHRFRKRMLGSLVEHREYERVAKMIEEKPLVPWEGEVNFQGLFAFCCLRLCEQFWEKKDYEKALFWAEKAGEYPATTYSARASKPQDATWRYWKGVVLESAGRADEAAAQFKLAADEQDWGMWHWISSETPIYRALARIRVGREKDAQADMKKLIEYTGHREWFFGLHSIFADYIGALAQLVQGNEKAARTGIDKVLKGGGLRYRAVIWKEEFDAAKAAKQPYKWPHQKTK